MDLDRLFDRPFKAILMGHEVFPVENIYEWSQWYDANYSKRHVAETQMWACWISTVFIGVDMAFGGPSLWFETMIFAPDTGFEGEYQERYATWDEAEAGHKVAEEWLIEKLKEAGFVPEKEQKPDGK